MKTMIRLLAAATLLTSAFAGSASAQIPANDTRGAAWAVVNLWDGVTAEAGMAWSANSGLNWQQKYSAWIQSMRKIARYGGEGGFTFEMTTPYGKTLPAPTADCADTSMILRMTFASWYGLPMLFRAGNYAIGHMGVWAYSAATRAWAPTNSVCASCDFTASAWDAVKKNWKPFGSYTWPTHAGLRTKSVGSGDDQPQIGGGKSGAYFDALFLNKRTGYVIASLLSNAGSGNLAGEQNVYNIQATALQAGDLTIERWQQDGIGHTIVIKEVIPTATGKKRVGIVAGWLPPRQSLWEDSVQAHGALSNEYMGSSECAETGANGACAKTYAVYGGGAKRWRAPKKDAAGRWVASVMDADLRKNAAGVMTYIAGTDYATLGARTGIFENLVDLPKPEELVTELVKLIGEKRQKIAAKPNTCSGREGREDLFDQLYSVMSENWGKTRAQVDAVYRTTADYVFAPLDYTTSSTCCWNGNGSVDNNNRLLAMGNSIVSTAVATAKRNGAACQSPAVFKKTAGAYQPYQSAATGVNWLPYSNDENCAQGRPTDPRFPNDTLKAWTVTPYCTVKPFTRE